MSAAEHEHVDAPGDEDTYHGSEAPRLMADVCGCEDLRVDAEIAHAIADLAANSTLTRGQAVRELLRVGMEAEEFGSSQEIRTDGGTVTAADRNETRRDIIRSHKQALVRKRGFVGELLSDISDARSKGRVDAQTEAFIRGVYHGLGFGIDAIDDCDVEPIYEPEGGEG